jgi:hypothetical protein
MVSLGRQFGVNTWAIEAMVRLACVAHGTNYFERGRTVEHMGLRGLRVSEVMRYVQEGEINPVYIFTAGGNGGSRRSVSPLEASQRR